MGRERICSRWCGVGEEGMGWDGLRAVMGGRAMARSEWDWRHNASRRRRRGSFAGLPTGAIN